MLVRTPVDLHGRRQKSGYAYGQQKFGLVFFREGAAIDRRVGKVSLASGHGERRSAV